MRSRVSSCRTNTDQGQVEFVGKAYTARIALARLLEKSRSPYALGISGASSMPIKTKYNS